MHGYEEELTELERTGIISLPIPNFISPVIIVPKKKYPSTHEIAFKMVIDFRKINEQLIYWSYPLMRIDRFFFLKIAWSKIILDITLPEDSMKYIAFITEYSKYEFLQLPFSIHVPPKYFAQLIDETLEGIDFCFTHLNDIIYSQNQKQKM